MDDVLQRQVMLSNMLGRKPPQQQRRIPSREEIGAMPLAQPLSQPPQQEMNEPEQRIAQAAQLLGMPPALLVSILTKAVQEMNAQQGQQESDEPE